MNYRYGKGVQKSALCWEVVPFSEGPLLEVPLYIDTFFGTLLMSAQRVKNCRTVQQLGMCFGKTGSKKNRHTVETVTITIHGK